MQATFSAGRYLGSIKSQVRLDDLVLSELTYAQDTAVLMHSHENPFLFFVLDGSQVEDLRSGSRSHRRGTLTLHPPQEPHCHKIGAGGLRSLNVEFGAHWLEVNPHGSRILQKPLHLETHCFPLIGHTARAMYTELSDQDDVSPLAIEAAVLSLLAIVSRASSAQSIVRSRWIKKARDFLHGRHTQHLSLKAVAGSVGVHPVHLAREFHKEYRCTVAEYIRRLRINSACEAIRNSETSLSQIALDSGFADQAHFSRVFKRVTGITPLQFKIRNRCR